MKQRTQFWNWTDQFSNFNKIFISWIVLDVGIDAECTIEHSVHGLSTGVLSYIELFVQVLIDHVQ